MMGSSTGLPGAMPPLAISQEERIRGSNAHCILQSACWDFQSPGGCLRQGCKWIHCPLDDWQMAWLRLQRFIFGGQLTTFDDLHILEDNVRRVFQEETRIA